jgi:uncharacterized repeat protein (TIGR03809 family)
MTHQLDVTNGRDIVARWCTLAERRLEYLNQLFETGRWRRYHSEGAFLENIREARAAVEVWRDLSSREASRDNRPIDMTWLERGRTRGEIWRDPVHLPKPAEFLERELPEHSIIADAEPTLAGDTLLAEVRGEDSPVPVQDRPAVVERYPLLRNMF